MPPSQSKQPFRGAAAATVANATRRQLFQRTGMGLGGFALTSLFQAEQNRAFGQEQTGRVLGTHHPARAKSVIYIHMVGAPSHLDLYDHKPILQERSGQLCPDEFFQGKQLAFIREQPKLFGTPKDQSFQFQRCGESGAEISNLMPNLQSVADDLCFIKTLHTDQFNHAPAKAH
ncbi:MAG: DUF1501 domain-containing protein, partial [Rhodopirellula sp. JB055]|uniref:DUF1501 domain-containing protein n=1 Tax=Rhodopirellula sp. JB055 TaxID=3342846 RepID=UPI00370AE2D3